MSDDEDIGEHDVGGAEVSLLVRSGAASVSSPRRTTRKEKLSIALVLCFVFFFKFKPSEPFLTEYLVEEKRIPKKVVDNEIYPIWIYAELCCLVIGSFLAELVGYRFFIICGAVCGTFTRLLLMFGISVRHMQMSQVTYAARTASEIICYSYIYLIVNPQNFQRFTSAIIAVSLGSHAGANVLGQVLTSHVGVSYKFLFYISGTSVGLATILSFILPRPTEEALNTRVDTAPPLKMSKIVNASPASINSEEQSADLLTRAPVSRFGFQDFIYFVKCTYAHPLLKLHSVWWIMAVFIDEMIQNYQTSLWKGIEKNVQWHGYVFAIAAVGSAIGSVIPSLLEQTCRRHAGMVLALTGVFAGGCALGMGITKSLYVSYGLYISYCVIWSFNVSTLHASCARLTGHGRFAVVFGLNTVLTKVLEVAIQAFLEWKEWELGQQFQLFGMWNIAAGSTFAIAVVVFYVRRSRTVTEEST